jgi:hypothetical protein
VLRAIDGAIETGPSSTKPDVFLEEIANFESKLAVPVAKVYGLCPDSRVSICHLADNAKQAITQNSPR